MCLMQYANNKGADQPAHPRSLISAFVVRCQDRMIPLVYITEISRFYLVSVAEQVSLCLAWSDTPEDTFSHGVAHMFWSFNDGAALLFMYSWSCVQMNPKHKQLQNTWNTTVCILIDASSQINGPHYFFWGGRGGGLWRWLAKCHQNGR